MAVPGWEPRPLSGENVPEHSYRTEGNEHPSSFEAMMTRLQSLNEQNVDCHVIHRDTFHAVPG